MPKILFQNVWNNHPFPNNPCDPAAFPNQSAICMGVALEKSNLDTSSFDTMYPRRRCYPGMYHVPRHILAPQELANWLDTQASHVGKTEKKKNVTSGNYGGRKGIVFIKKGLGSKDYIDVWNGQQLKSGNAAYFSLGQEIWFWELP